MLAACGKAPDAPVAAYAPAGSCAGCHAKQWQGYGKTAMARSFRAATAANIPEIARGGRFDHAPSVNQYRFVPREGRFFLRREQAGGENAFEAEIHYVMGSGAHARSYLHRTPQNRVVELPVAWYPERGGYFAMSPGYDRPNHPDFSRRVSHDCMFCHNAYPESGVQPAGHEPLFPGELPQGIDCQRCHGPARTHVESGGRAAVVNPRKLDPARAMEVCIQCHLETTSFPLPNSIVRFDRGAYSYRPGEPLADFQLHFDHAPGAGRGDKFEIVNSVYRLRKSACFTRSGRMTCTTCHDPHDVPRGEAASAHFRRVCQGCHATLPASHPPPGDCVSCHMPKRRTEDVVHAVMTDHLIQRRKPPGDPLAPLAERREIEGKSAYQGDVVGYYPEKPDELYLAMAQVLQKSNLAAGTPRFEQALATARPKEPGFYFNAAQAWLAQGRLDDAIRQYEAALSRDPDYLPAMRSYGAVLLRRGESGRAVNALEKAKARWPLDPTTRHELGRALAAAGRGPAAIDEVREAIRFEPDFVEAHDTLGGLLLAAGDRTGAEAAARESVRIQPSRAAARVNLANLLAAQERYPEARKQVSEAVRLDGANADARELLGNLHAADANWTAALAEYSAALRTDPAHARASLGAGTALAAMGRPAEARGHLDKAAASKDPEVRQEAVDLLRQLSGR